MKKKTKQKKKIKPPQQQPAIDIEASSQRTATESDLKKISAAAERLRSIQRDLETTQDRVRELTMLQDRVQFEELPALMEACGMAEFKLTDGSRVSIKPVVKASLPTDNWIARTRDPDERGMLKDRLERGLAYLKTHDAESLIKNTIKVELGKGKNALVQRIKHAMRNLGVEVVVTTGVHPQTLTAWVRERLADGKPVDMSLFGVFSGNLAKIEYPKQDRPIPSGDNDDMKEWY